MSSKKNGQLKSTETSSALWKLWNEWRIFLWGFFRPLVIIPLVITVVSLIIANDKDVDRTLSLVLQIIAALLAAIAGKFFYDVIRNVFESNILVKKGLSAVRNLSLARVKTKIISDRAKQNATTEEIRNLLSLLEKDIANATQEWNDILPGVDKLEVVYTLLAEKESELEHIEKQKEQLNKQLVERGELSDKEIGNLKKMLDEKESKISDLSYEISRLRLKTEPLVATASGTYPLGSGVHTILGTPIFGGGYTFKKCETCGKIFSTSDFLQKLCPYCLSKNQTP
jgi:hypothetical protein